MNIYEKLATARACFKAQNIKQSGNNTFVGYKYFDLTDILPATTTIEKELKMLSVVKFGADTATLTVYNAEKPDEFITFSSPMSTAEIKGCHPVQNLGAVETYVRRYLYLTAYEIVESEALDKTQGKPDSKAEKPTDQRADQNRPQPTKTEQPHSDLTLEQAKKMSFKNGRNANKPFAELTSDDLTWAAETLSNIYGEAAKMVLASRQNATQESLDDIIAIDNGELPF